MLKSIEFVLIVCALLVLILACNLSVVSADPRVQTFQSKIELVSETSNSDDKFSGNTSIEVNYKNHELLNQEQEAKIKRNELKSEDRKPIPLGGLVQIKFEAASEENATLDKIEIWITANGERKRYVSADFDFEQGVKFSHVDDEYNLRVYTNAVRFSLKEKSIKPLALEIIDNHVGKTTKFDIYPYYNK
jgi:hypothetical protein